MMISLKKKLGFVKRGAVGFWQNWLERQPMLVDCGRPTIIGSSVQGRNIDCVKIGQGNEKVLLVAGIHGNEVGTVKLANYLINWLFASADEYWQFTFYVIPCLNPDGYELAKQQPDYFGGGRVGRFNANQVDLNRNFSTPSFQSESVWSTGKNYAEQKKVFCGNSPGSEPEIQALLKLIGNEQIQIYIAFHSVAGDVMANNNLLAQNMADAFAAAAGYFREPDDHWGKLKQTGTAKEWCDQKNIAYLEIESRYRWSADWPAHQIGLAGVLKILSK